MSGPTHGLFSGLFDDAALFPPGDAPMTAAVPAHRELRARLGGLVGPFVVPAARLEELLAELSDVDPFPVSLISPAGTLPAAVAQVQADQRLQLVAVEVPGAVDTATAAEAVRVLDDVVPPGATAAVELPRAATADAVLDVLISTGHRAKLRTGGVRADLFPDAAELASTVRSCVTRQIAFKCTAGLHHAVRQTDPVTGFDHHGFLNVLLATDALVAGAPVAVAADWLREDRPTALCAAVATWTPTRIARARAAFRSFGTCSVLEPVDDLVALGLLPPRERSHA